MPLEGACWWSLINKKKNFGFVIYLSKNRLNWQIVAITFDLIYEETRVEGEGHQLLLPQTADYIIFFEISTTCSNYSNNWWPSAAASDLRGWKSCCQCFYYRY